ncbi:hypothetical protein Tco_0141604, partial [Tanacetum coccineum]
MDYQHLFTEFNDRIARQACLNVKVRMQTEMLKLRKVVSLRVRVSAAKAAEKVHANEMDAMKQKNVALKNERDSLNGKVTELQSSVFCQGS